MTCHAVGPFGEVCTRGEHADDRHSAGRDDTAALIAGPLPEPVGDTRSMQLASWSIWTGDYRRRS